MTDDIRTSGAGRSCLFPCFDVSMFPYCWLKAPLASVSLGHLLLGQNHLISLNIQLATIMWRRPKEYPRILFWAGGGGFETHSAVCHCFSVCFVGEAVGSWSKPGHPLFIHSCVPFVLAVTRGLQRASSVHSCAQCVVFQQGGKQTLATCGVSGSQ